MDYYSNHIKTLIDELGRLPGVGAKSAARLAFHIINPLINIFYYFFAFFY